MNPQTFIPATISYITAITAALVSLYSWRWRMVRGGVFFILLMMSIAVFAFANGEELAGLTYAYKITWAKLSYLGLVSLPPLWFLFSASYSQHDGWFKPARVAILWIIPCLTLALVMTNEYHGLIWSSVTASSPQPGTRLIYTHGIFFWVHAVYAYLLLLVATVWYARAVRLSTDLLRNQMVVLLVAALIPWAANFLYLVNLNPWPGLDLTPIAFLITGLAAFFNIFHYQMLDLVPIAHDIIFENITDSVVVLDAKDRVINMNPTARNWFVNNDHLIGCDFFETVQMRELETKYKHLFEGQTQLEILVDGDHRVFDLTISPLRNDHGRLVGRVALFHDISREKLLLDAEQRRSRQMQLLNEMTRVALSMTNLEELLQAMADRLSALLNAEDTCLSLWNDFQQRIVYTASNSHLFIGHNTTVPSAITTTIIKNGNFLAIENTLDTAFFTEDTASLFPARALLAFPLISNNQKLGVAVICFKQTRHFSLDEINLGRQACGQIALAIDKINLYNREIRRADQLTAIQSVSQIVTSSLELSQIFVTVVKVLHDRFGYHYVSIYRLEGDSLHMGAQIGYPEELLILKVPVNRGILGRTVRTRSPQFVQDVTADPDFLRASYEVNQEICVPLIKENNILGTLNVESAAQQMILTDDDLNLLLTFANQVVVAIENARLYAEVQRLAILDELTGLYNRRGFFEIGRRELERANRLNRMLSVLFVDIDHFKLFNDTYSYAFGDMVLSLLAGSLRSTLRDIDLIGRYGGEEFVVILPEIDEATAIMVAEHLRHQIETMPIKTENGVESLTVSIGVCQKTAEILDLGTLLDRAGQALHVAKNKGRNCVSVSVNEAV